MRTIEKLGLAAVLLAGTVIGPTVVSAQDQNYPPTRHEQRVMDREQRAADREARKGPRADFRGQHPSRDFRQVPPDFHGATRPDRSAMRTTNPERGTFHGRTFAEFSVQDRQAWRTGTWRHTWHNGQFGWWWFVDGFWFFYAAPIYPFPTFIGLYYDVGYSYDYYWYWCDDPPGYYPYVRYCYSGWVPVPPYYPY